VLEFGAHEAYRLQLRGTVARGDAYLAQRSCRIIGGANGWSQQLPPKHYHNDARVKARLVADDLAAATGETIGVFSPQYEYLGVDYVRDAGPAAHTLEAVIGTSVWWVDYDGLTYVGTRPERVADTTQYDVLDYNPRSRVATFGLNDLAALQLGDVVSSPVLEGEHKITELELRIEPGVTTATAWLGPERSSSRLASLLTAIGQKGTKAQLFGVYRYRVVRMNATRVELQAVRAELGLPDILPASQWPGMPGLNATLAQGAQVLVSFIDGDRTAPIVTHYAGPDGAGFAPVHLVLGDKTGKPAARQDDAVEVILPPAVITGTLGPTPGGTPITGVVTFMLDKTMGKIVAGSNKVDIA
jgi:hypothetical protein